MHINKRMKAVLKAVTRLEANVKETYILERRLENLSAKLPEMPLNYKTWDKVIETGSANIPIRVFEPLDKYSDAMLLFFHGGGWVLGNIDKYKRVCARLAVHTGQTVVSVDYRLAPEYKFPIGLNDCYLAAREIFVSGCFETPQEKITIIGDSAGGNIAAALSLMARDRGEFMPSKQILVYPATNNDHSEGSSFESMHENGQGYLLTQKRIEDFTQLYRRDENDLYNAYYAPLIEDDLTNQPKTLVITAQYDPLRDEGEAYGDKLRLAGNTVEVCRIEDAIHGFFLLPLRFPQVKEAYKAINEFLLL